MRKSLGDTIVALLKEDEGSSETISIGYEKTTVYGTQRRRRRGKVQHPTSEVDEPLSSTADRARHCSVDYALSHTRHSWRTWTNNRGAANS